MLTLKGQRKDQELHSNSNSNWHLRGWVVYLYFTGRQACLGRRVRLCRRAHPGRWAGPCRRARLGLSDSSGSSDHSGCRARLGLWACSGCRARPCCRARPDLRARPGRRVRSGHWAYWVRWVGSGRSTYSGRRACPTDSNIFYKIIYFSCGRWKPMGWPWPTRLLLGFWHCSLLWWVLFFNLSFFLP